MLVRNMLFLMSLGLFLTSCSLFPTKDNNHHRICSELKHRIVFSGGAEAKDPNQAMAERSDQAKLNQDYNDERCD